MNTTPREIRAIRDEQLLLQKFAEFEQQVDQDLVPLRAMLARQPLTKEVPQLEMHMSFVESFRDRVARRHAIACCFHEHAKSHYFLLAKTEGITREDRDAYQKSVTAGMLSCREDLEKLVDSIDSRVNLVKRLLGPEYSVGGKRINQ